MICFIILVFLSSQEYTFLQHSNIYKFSCYSVYCISLYTQFKLYKFSTSLIRLQIISIIFNKRYLELILIILINKVTYIINNSFSDYFTPSCGIFDEESIQLCNCNKIKTMLAANLKFSKHYLLSSLLSSTYRGYQGADSRNNYFM